MELALEQFLTWDDLILGGSSLGEVINAVYHNRYGLGKHSSIGDIERVCGTAICKEYLIFATIRNPLDRLCSLYNFIGAFVQNYLNTHHLTVNELRISVIGDGVDGQPELAWPASAAFLESADFSTFVRNERLSRDEAAQTQVSRLRSSVDHTIPAKALRLENCREWLGRLKMALELPVIAFPHANRSERTLITPNQVSHDDRLFIEEWFHEDYAAFQYPASA